MDIYRLAQRFSKPTPTIRARFGNVVQVNADRTIDVLVGGMVTDVDEAAGFVPDFAAMSATGGTIGTASIDGVTYRTHTFTSGTGSFVITDAGSDAVLEVFAVGGGGGGGAAELSSAAGGGGGGEVVLESSADILTGGTHTVIVGAGGTAGTIVAGAATKGGAGGVTTVMPEYESALQVTALGGGGGGAGGNASVDGDDGGSGGGGGADNTTAGAGGASTSVQGYGNAGGVAAAQGTAASRQAGGGGGGAGSFGQAGFARPSPFAVVSEGGAGGQGLLDDFTGTAQFYAGGGGGGGAVAGLAGEGGGGDGAEGGVSPSVGTANTGGGGGGAYALTKGEDGADGGSGLVVLRYQISGDVAPSLTTGIQSDQVNGVPFLGRSVPVPGTNVLLLSDGQDLLALDTVAAEGTTIAPRRYRTTNQTIPSGTGTVVEFADVDNDLLGMVGPVGGTAWPSRLYAHIPGWYQATVNSYWGSSNNDVDTWVRLNGSTVLARQSESPDGTHPLYQSVTTPVFYMAVDHYVEMMVAHDAGVDRTLVYESEYLPSLSLTFIGP